MFAFPETGVPVPDRLADQIGRKLPIDILEAQTIAQNSAYVLRLCRTPQTRRGREAALADLARANKVLAAYNPGLIVTPT